MNDREQFEEAVCQIVPLPLFQRNEFGEYTEIMVQGFWSLWQAAVASKLAPSDLHAAIMALPLPEPFMKMRFNAKARRWDEVGDEAWSSDTRVYSQGQVNEFRYAAAALAASVQVPVVQAIPEGWRQRLQQELAAQEKHYGEVSACAAAGSRLHQGEADCTEGVLIGIGYCIDALEKMEAAAAPVAHSDDKGE